MDSMPSLMLRPSDFDDDSSLSSCESIDEDYPSAASIPGVPSVIDPASFGPYLDDFVITSSFSPVDSSRECYALSRYHVSVHVRSKRGALVDRGANGCIAGADANVIHTQVDKHVDVTGIDNHELSSLPMVDVSALLISDKGPVIGIFRQYAYHGLLRTIHSSAQMEHYKNDVHDKSMRCGGRQCIITNDGFAIPIDIINGLPYVKMRPNTDAEWNKYPHVIMTSGDHWDPTVLDNVISDKPHWYNDVQDLMQGALKSPFDEFGNYKKRQIPKVPQPVINPEVPLGTTPDIPPDPLHAAQHRVASSSVDLLEEPYPDAPFREFRAAFHDLSNLNQVYFVEHLPVVSSSVSTFCILEHTVEAASVPRESAKKDPDYSKYRPYFLFVPIDKVKKTFENSTQFAAHVLSGPHIYQTLKSPYPANNVWRRNEPVASDSVFAEVAALCTNGQKSAQIFVGRKSLVIDVFGMSSTSEFVNTLEDVIRKRGAMDKLITDSASVEMSARVLDIIRALCIDDWQSEAKYQHQDFAEHRWGHLKRCVEWIMNFRNVPPEAWLLCLKWTADIMNHTAEKSLGWRLPIEVLTGQTPDISIFLCFLFWDVVYVARYKDSSYGKQVGSVKSSEVRAHFVGFAWDCGHAMTFVVYTCDTKRLLKRSKLRLAKDGENNLKLEAEAGKVPQRVFIRSKRDMEDGEVRLPTIDISKSPFEEYYSKDDPEMLFFDDDADVDEECDEDDCTTPTTEREPSTEDKTPPWKASQDRILNPTATPEKTDRGATSNPTTNTDGSVPIDGPPERKQKKAVRFNLDRDRGDGTQPPGVDRGDKPTLRRSARLRGEKPSTQPEVFTASSEKSAKETEMSTAKAKPKRSRKSKVIVETVNDNDEAYSPLDGPPLRDRNYATPEYDDEGTPYAYDSSKESGDHQDPRTFGFDKHRMKTDNPTIPNLPPDEMIDRTFLLPPSSDGTRVRAKIIEQIRLSKEELAKDPKLIKFRCKVDDRYDEIVAYNDIVDYIEQDQTWDGIWKFRNILDHKPVKRSSKEYRGSSTNLLIEWETGEVTWEPLTTEDKSGMFDMDPVTVAIYADKHNLLDAPGWRLPSLRKCAKTQKRILRLANQAKLHSFRTKPVYMYGFLVPRNHDQAMQLDKENGNTRWRDAEKIELAQVDEYDTFLDKGKGYIPNKDFKKIKVHLVYAVKHDGRHKARLVAGGHLTDTPIDSVYSSVVSLRGIRIITFLAELNNLECWATDIGNAYLESYTQEKVYVIAGPEFGDREGHTLIISKALYGLKSSGLRWSQRLSDVLRDMGFFPSKAEKDIWMRDKGDHYEYIAVYVDDLLIASKCSGAIIQELTDKYEFKLKGTGPISFHLGCDFFRDETGTLCYAPLKYIEKMMSNYERIFGKKPRQYSSPLEEGDHPELDDSEYLDLDDIKIYQSLIGALQWVIQIGRLDVATAVMTMSRFRAMPRVGHLERVKRIHGYISKMRFAVIRIRTDEPDLSDIPEKHYDWEHTAYGGAKETIPDDCPKPLGKRVQTLSYVDANLYHDMLSGKSVTGIIHLLNKTVIDWFSKLQSTVETATFGSEYVAARTCTEQIIALRNTLRYLGVPIVTSSFMFGDNESVVNTASIPHSRLHKRHMALSYHKTRASIAARILRFHHVPGKGNPADVVSKHWSYSKVWPVLRPILFWKGDTAAMADFDVAKFGDVKAISESKDHHEGSDKVA